MGTRERRQREQSQRREDILAAARKLFWEKGFAAATMPQIAAKAELAPGTLYLYFPSKDALYTELLVEGYDKLESALNTAICRGTTPRQRAEFMVDAFLGFARNHPQYFEIIFFLLQRETRASVDDALQPQQLARLHERQKACKLLAGSVVREHASGISPDALSTRVDAIWSMLSGVVFYFRTDADFAKVGNAVKSLLIGGLAG